MVGASKISDQDALDFHAQGKPGKLESWKARKPESWESLESWKAKSRGEKERKKAYLAIRCCKIIVR